MRQELETILYHQRLTYKAWQNKAFFKDVKPSDKANRLVWELLVAFGDGMDNFDLVSEDIYQIAYELAEIELKKSPVEEVTKYYRDYLLDVMIEIENKKIPDIYPQMIRFANIISSAICDANSEILRRSIRHSRTERLSQELSIAKRIQSHLLPNAPPSMPGFDFAGRLVPAAEIGGDYWSIKFQRDENVVTIKLADITGHGIAAATLVAAVKFISGGYYKGSKSAAEVMKLTNRVLTQDTPHEILVSMVYGWLHPDTYTIDLVNAGHSPAFICGEKICMDIPLNGPLMGLDENAEYSEMNMQLNKHDIIFFGSDGIIEAGVGERFGLERLKELVVGNKHLLASEIADLVVKTIEDYGGQPQDDISLVVIKVTGNPPTITGKL